MSKEELTLQIQLLLNKFVHIFFDGPLQLSVVSLQLPIIPKEILVQPCPGVIAFLWKKGIEVFEVKVKASARTSSTRCSGTSI